MIAFLRRTFGTPFRSNSQCGETATVYYSTTGSLSIYNSKSMVRVDTVEDVSQRPDSGDNGENQEAMAGSTRSLCPSEEGAAQSVLLSLDREGISGTPSTDITGEAEEDEAVGMDGRLRQGTISSARLNIWSTMVGGGSLSLPLAFGKTGNALLGPLLLILTAAITEFCVRVLLDAARTMSVNNGGRDPRVRGTDSLESISAAAFGVTAFRLSTALVYCMCFFGIVGYCVLLRDMLEPVTDFWSPGHRSATSSTAQSFSVSVSSATLATPSWADNLTMVAVVIAMTPLCTLQTLTALKYVGAASMCAVLILGVCIVYRSVQCTAGILDHHHPDGATESYWTDGFRLFPESWKDVLDVIPLFISCYVCHYNVPVVHNDLKDPTISRVRWWVRSTVWGSTCFYVTIGIAGSAYATACSDTFHGNILLDFPEDDPLLLIGRLCLAVTIALAFPVLTIPARDIVIRTTANWSISTPHGIYDGSQMSSPALTEPLLPQSEDSDEPTRAVPIPESANDEEQNVGQETTPASTVPPTLWVRFFAAISVFWTGTGVACFVSSIDLVWDFLGSTLSILLSFIIPCGCFVVIAKQKADRGSLLNSLSIVICWALILFFTPLMFVSTANAVYNTFIRA